MNARDVLLNTSTGLHSVAEECKREDLRAAMKGRSEEFDRAVAAVDRLATALRTFVDHTSDDTFAGERHAALQALAEYPLAPAPRLLTDEQRVELVDTLIEDFLDFVSQDGEAPYEIAKDGFIGFRKRSDAELLKAYTDAFDEDFLDKD